MNVIVITVVILIYIIHHVIVSANLSKNQTNTIPLIEFISFLTIALLLKGAGTVDQKRKLTGGPTYRI